MRRLLCALGIHKYQTLDMTSHYKTTYTDMPNWSPIHHIVWYQQCACCMKRRMKDTVKKDRIGFNKLHRGVEYARVAWEVHGVMTFGEGKTVETNNPPPKPRKPKLKVVDGGKNS